MVEVAARCYSDNPPPPKWIDAVNAVAKIPSKGDSAVAHILEVINNTLNKQHKSSMQEFRKSMRDRHSLLKKMAPYWRRVATTLDKVGSTITGLQERAKVIDNKMK